MTNQDNDFFYSDISEELYQKMLGKSIPLEFVNEVDLTTLSHLKVKHYGFDGKIHSGEIVANRLVADDLLDIFHELFNHQYKIEKIKLIDEYNGNDELSMEDNNSSSFNYRKIYHTNQLSNHSFGRAIDINPLYNPYIVENKVFPINANDYVDRSKEDFRYIKKNDFIYQLFISKGWSWGGDWTHAKDYQHFEKLEK